MLSRPTTEQVLLSIADNLQSDIVPVVHDEPAKVMLAMMDQLLRGCAQRAAHEIAWMHEEAEAVVAAAQPFAGDRAVAESLAVLAATPDGLHLDEACARYDLASQVLSAAIEAAFASGDVAGRTSLFALLRARNGHELAIIGSLNLVGRG